MNGSLNIEEKPVSTSKTYRRYHDNGKLKEEIEVANGKRNGISKYYYETGELLSECSYVLGNKHGTYK